MERIESESEYLEEERRGIQEEPQPKINLDFLVTLGEEKGFEVEENIDYGYGTIDLVWYLDLHPFLQSVRCGFIVLGSEEEELYDISSSSKDSEDNQYSIRKIEEAAIRGIRSGMDKVFLVVQNKEMAKSVSGKIEWLASFGSLLRLDVICLGVYPEQKEPVVITPSQQRVPEGEKLRKESIREREEKFDEYNRPKGEKAERESKEKKITREVMLDEHSRPEEQKKSDEAIE
jgi:hypothetical protein